MKVDRWNKGQWDPIACESRTPIVAFKASTILQGLGMMASKQFLVSGATVAQLKQRTYCPSIDQYTEEFFAPHRHTNSGLQHAQQE